MRDFRQAGTGHDQDGEVPPRNARLRRSVFDQGWAILARREDPLVVDDELPVAFGVLLDLGSMLGPIVVVRHPLFHPGHPAMLHGGSSDERLPRRPPGITGQDTVLGPQSSAVGATGHRRTIDERAASAPVECMQAFGIAGNNPLYLPFRVFGELSIAIVLPVYAI